MLNRTRCLNFVKSTFTYAGNGTIKPFPTMFQPLTNAIGLPDIYFNPQTLAVLFFPRQINLNESALILALKESQQ